MHIAFGSDLGVIHEQFCITLRFAGNGMLQGNFLQLPNLCLAMCTDGD